MDAAPPSLSIVIPVYNAARHLGPTLDSIRDQGTTGYEVVIVDDGSTDDITAVLAGASLPIEYLRQQNRGPSAARNAGAAASRGEYLVFLDSDDRLEQGWLTAFTRAIEDGPASIHCSVRVIDEQSGDVTVVAASARRPAFCGATGARLPGSYAIERKWFTDVGGFCPELRYGEHTELWLRLAAAIEAGGGREVVLPAVLITKYHDRSPAKVASYDRVRKEGAEYVLTTHDQRLRSDPAFRSDYHAVAGVAAIRLGNVAEGRTHLREAARLGRSPRRTAQYLLSCAPVIGPAFWRRKVPR